jgi:hypothetical protein
MKGRHLSGLAIACAMALGAGTAQAECMTKGANATAGSAESAKWYVMETMVQSVSWGLWPSYVASGSVPGYTIKDQKYTCNNTSGGVFCRGRATFCTTK